MKECTSNKLITTLTLVISQFKLKLRLVVGGNHKMRAASKPNWLWEEDQGFYHSISSNQPCL